MDDGTKLRSVLAETWRKAAADFRAAGAPADQVFGSLLATGLAGLVEAHGKSGAARILLDLVATLDRGVSDEAAAVRQATAEARGATRN